MVEMMMRRREEKLGGKQLDIYFLASSHVSRSRGVFSLFLG
jgi:hypothetical protein